MTPRRLSSSVWPLATPSMEQHGTRGPWPPWPPRPSHYHCPFRSIVCVQKLPRCPATLFKKTAPPGLLGIFKGSSCESLPPSPGGRVRLPLQSCTRLFRATRRVPTGEAGNTNNIRPRFPTSEGFTDTRTLHTPHTFMRRGLPRKPKKTTKVSRKTRRRRTKLRATRLKNLSVYNSDDVLP